MTPIDPCELSAFLDGELPPPRAEAVRLALAEDPVLREEFERLAALDSEWKTEAQAARFRPRVRTPVSRPRGRIPIVGLVVAFAAFRFLLKCLPPIPGGLLEACALVLILGWGVRYLVGLSDLKGIPGERFSPM